MDKASEHENQCLYVFKLDILFSLEITGVFNKFIIRHNLDILEKMLRVKFSDFYYLCDYSA